MYWAAGFGFDEGFEKMANDFRREEGSNGCIVAVAMSEGYRNGIK